MLLLFRYTMNTYGWKRESIKKYTLVTHSHKYAWQNIYNDDDTRSKQPYRQNKDKIVMKKKCFHESAYITYTHIRCVDSKWYCYVIQNSYLLFKVFFMLMNWMTNYWSHSLVSYNKIMNREKQVKCKLMHWRNWCKWPLYQRLLHV